MDGIPVPPDRKILARPARVTSRNDRFQQWKALLENRQKRQKSGQLVVQGVRPISLALEHGWPPSAVLYDLERARSGALSRWASGILDRCPEVAVGMSPELLAELGDRSDGSPELVAVVGFPPDDLSRIAPRLGLPAAPLILCFDRPGSPGNIGTLVRSADAFGASGVIVTGHAADVYDPKAIRASTGSLFALPVVRVPSHREVLAWRDGLRQDHGLDLAVVGTDERAETDLEAHDLTRATLLLVGSETAGLSVAWREACQHLVRIPMAERTGASSLNAAAAATVVLYEAARQRRRRS